MSTSHTYGAETSISFPSRISHPPWIVCLHVVYHMCTRTAAPSTMEKPNTDWGTESPDLKMTPGFQVSLHYSLSLCPLSFHIILTNPNARLWISTSSSIFVGYRCQDTLNWTISDCKAFPFWWKASDPPVILPQFLTVNNTRPSGYVWQSHFQFPVSCTSQHISPLPIPLFIPIQKISCHSPVSPSCHCMRFSTIF